LTDTQILTLVIGITFPVLGIIGAIVAVLCSNKRIDDTNVNLSKRMDDLKAELIKHMDNGFEHMELLLKLHEEEHHKK
jgi:uncharacterized membrane protein YbaN (DUF454 family)